MCGRPSITIHPTRRRFPVDEYHQMIRAGILAEDDRVELAVADIMD
ncbi:MAG TPA: hypothetical protein VIN09_02305 [Chloroflexota bacterium]